ncbi:MAG: sulfurtransferase TusA family protein [Rhodospirillales bacterium]|nr:sulfurtransferase TusA family protein [Rhodospirillales bacterium]
MTASQRLDARGLKCPLPVLKARKAMKALAAGETLEVLASDPSAPQDFRSFCETTGHRLRDSSEETGIYRFLLEKAPS